MQMKLAEPEKPIKTRSAVSVKILNVGIYLRKRTPQSSKG
jgi:hypothetical protein